jgi:hypothetical protein
MMVERLLFEPILNAGHKRSVWSSPKNIWSPNSPRPEQSNYVARPPLFTQIIHPRVLSYAAFGDYEVPAITQAKLIETSVSGGPGHFLLLAMHT